VAGDRSPLRAVVAEDQPLLRDGIASLLELGGFAVVGRCENADDLLLKVRSYAPDVAVVDIRMPPTFTDEGLRAAVEIRSSHPGTGVLVLSQHIEPEHAARLVASDASGVGYLLKERVRDGESFIDAVERVASGGTAFDPQVIAALVAGKGHTAGERLSEREMQVLSLMAEGLSNAEISKRLFLSARAVERDISAVFSKLDLPTTDAHNRRVLAVLAFLGIRQAREQQP
jgi:DNA-binding NarL/FixJ family response regulator